MVKEEVGYYGPREQMETGTSDSLLRASRESFCFIQEPGSHNQRFPTYTESTHTAVLGEQTSQAQYRFQLFSWRYAFAL